MRAVHAIRRMTLDDVDVVGAVQARAFFDDPLQVWAIPDDGIRLALLQEMFTVLGRAVHVPNGDALHRHHMLGRSVLAGARTA